MYRCRRKFVAAENNSHMQQYGLGLGIVTLWKYGGGKNFPGATNFPRHWYCSLTVVLTGTLLGLHELGLCTKLEHFVAIPSWNIHRSLKSPKNVLNFVFFLLFARYVPNVAKRSMPKISVILKTDDRPTTDLCSWKSLPGSTSNGHTGLSITVL